MTIPAFLLGRRAALGALALCVAAVLALAAGIFLWTLRGSDAPDENIRILARLRAQAAARPAAERALAETRAQANTLPSLLRGDSTALAQAALQSDLKAIAEANGSEVRSALLLPVAGEHGLERISVQYDLMVPASKLRALAHAIESRVPYLFISSIDLAVAQGWPRDPKAPEAKFEVRWTVSGYRLGAAR